MTAFATPPPSGSAPKLRAHQRALLRLMREIAAKRMRGVTDVLAAVTPGGGKSLLPVIAAARLMEAGIVARVVWVVPRDSLRLQAEEAFADPVWRGALHHRVSVRAADNGPDPARGLAGYVTTYQAIAARPELHVAECRRVPTLLVTDEIHHLPALTAGGGGAAAPLSPRSADLFAFAEADEAAEEEAVEAEASAWSRALVPVLEAARLRLHLSGTLARADGRPVLWLPYRRGKEAGTRELDLRAPGWAVIGYSRAQALRERAVLPVTFGALDGEARWSEKVEGLGTDGRVEVGPHRLAGLYPSPATRPALFTALRTGFAEALLRLAVERTRQLRAERRAARGLEPGDPASAARGLGKLLVVAPDQEQARRYLDLIRAWLPGKRAERAAMLAVSDERGAAETIAAFRLTPEPSILVTVAMAYEGLDAPEIAVVAALTHIRSRPWLEQMIARATRVDPHGGPLDEQRALVFHPDDPLFGQVRQQMEAEQQWALKPRTGRRKRGTLPDWLRAQAELRHREPDIVPLESNATSLRFVHLRAGPEAPMGAAAPPDAEMASEPPSRRERRLKRRLAEAVAAQIVEDGQSSLAETAVGRHAPSVPPLFTTWSPAPLVPNLNHLYNAVLKRVLGKPRGGLTLAELEAALSWLERNRLRNHLHLLDDDPRYAWTARQRARAGTRPHSRPKAPARRDEGPQAQLAFF